MERDQLLSRRFAFGLAFVTIPSKQIGKAIFAPDYAAPGHARLQTKTMSDFEPSLPYLRRHNGRVQLMVEGAPLRLLAGEVHNSASSSLAHMEGVFERALALECNALLVPVSWELCEPREGEWDFAIVDGLLEGARRRGLRLVPLWFGAFKNSFSTYAPPWVKTDLARFPRAQIAPGENVGALCVWSDEAARCDARAFAALMRHLRQRDAEQQTVVMVQVENEVGLLRAPRDLSPLSQRAFESEVPSQLLDYLTGQRAELRSELRAHWDERARGDWRASFGAGADEVFMAWGFARFCERVARTGRDEYDLPMLVNAWLVQFAGQEPGKYPSGGPVAHMADVWRAGAPSIEVLAIDVYLDDFKGVCADYARDGNPLLVAEARRDESVAAKAWWSFGAHDALCYAPFGIESVGLAPHGVDPLDGIVALGSQGNSASAHSAVLLRETYRLLRDMAPLLDKWGGSSHIAGVMQTGPDDETLELGGYRLTLQYADQDAIAQGRAPAGGLVIAPAEGEFIVAGYGFRVKFASLDQNQPHVDFLELWEGDFHGGAWIAGRRLNGDEGALRLNAMPGARRARVYRYGNDENRGVK